MARGLTSGKLSILLKGGSKQDISVDEILGWLLNISFALLFIFIIASVLFATKAEKEIEILKDELNVLGGKYEYISNTEKGEIYKDFEKALIDVQRQKLLLGLEQIVFDVRNSFGLTHFGTTNEKGEREYLLSDILSRGKVVNERFKRGCVLANQVLSDQEQMQQDLLHRVLLKKGMILNRSSVESSLIENPEIVSGENAQWLFKQVSSRVKAINADCCIMQKTVLAYLMIYYQEHMDVLMDADLNEQLEQVLEEASEEEKVRRISEFSQRLYQHVKSFFDEQNVPLLDGV